jgi:hypothetical protein
MRYYRANILTVAVLFCFGLFMIAMAGCGPAEGPKGPTRIAQKPAEKTAETPRAVPSAKPITEERTYYDFEGDLDGWEVPMWALGKSDYVAKEVTISEDVASNGKSSMKMEVDFPGGTWTAGLTEIQQYLDMSRYRVIRVDIYLPADAPIGLKAKFILTVGSNWKFVEMSRSVPLIPGEWATITANIEPGSYDWKRVVPDEKFAEDVRKIAVRIESNRKPKYTGTIYVDNVRVGR